MPTSLAIEIVSCVSRPAANQLGVVHVGERSACARDARSVSAVTESFNLLRMGLFLAAGDAQIDGQTRRRPALRGCPVTGRTKTDGPPNYPAVHKIQAGFKVTLLCNTFLSIAAVYRGHRAVFTVCEVARGFVSGRCI
jgi:hypothetical protein